MSSDEQYHEEKVLLRSKLVYRSESYTLVVIMCYWQQRPTAPTEREKFNPIQILVKDHGHSRNILFYNDYRCVFARFLNRR